MLRPKLVLLLTDVLQGYLFASLSASACPSRRLLYFCDTGSHVVRATIQQFVSELFVGNFILKSIRAHLFAHT